MGTTAMSPAEFEQALRAKGACYHIHHPFHRAMHEGRASREQIRGWVANRYYYQRNIPTQDAAILANCQDRAVRRQWLRRILEQDGAQEGEGGIEAWLRLAEAVGLERGQVLSEELVLPGVRFAVDAYVNFARRASWQEAAILHRAVRPADPPVAPGRLAAPLPLDRAGRLRLLPPPPGRGAPGRRARPAYRPRALSQPRGPGAHAGDPAVQAGRALEPARRSEHGLRTGSPAVPHGDRRACLAPGDRPVSAHDERLDRVPALRRGFRFQWEPAQATPRA